MGCNEVERLAYLREKGNRASLKTFKPDQFAFIGLIIRVQVFNTFIS